MGRNVRNSERQTTQLMYLPEWSWNSWQGTGVVCWWELVVEGRISGNLAWRLRAGVMLTESLGWSCEPFLNWTHFPYISYNFFGSFSWVSCWHYCLFLQSNVPLLIFMQVAPGPLVFKWFAVLPSFWDCQFSRERIMLCISPDNYQLPARYLLWVLPGSFSWWAFPCHSGLS